MSKKRVYEIAKELNVSTQTVLEKLSEMGVTVKNNPSASVEDKDAQRLTEKIKGINKQVQTNTAIQSNKDSGKKDIRKDEEKQKDIKQRDGKSIDDNQALNSTKKAQDIQNEKPAQERPNAARPNSDIQRQNPAQRVNAEGKPSEQRPKRPDGAKPFRPKAYVDGKLIEIGPHRHDNARPHKQRPVSEADKQQPQAKASIEPTKEKPQNIDDVKPQSREDAVAPQTTAQKPYEHRQNQNSSSRPQNAGGQRYQNSSGQRPPYNPDGRPPQRTGEQRPYSNTSGQRPPYNPDGRPPQRTGEQRPYTNTSGQRPPYNPDGRPPQRTGEQRPYTNTSGQRPPYNPDGRPPQRTGEQRPGYNSGSGSYGQRPQGQGSYTPKPGGFGGRGSFDKDRDDKPQQRFSPKGTPKMDRGSVSAKQAAEKPDKNERSKKIEASKRLNNQDRNISSRAERHAPKPVTKQVVAPSEPKVIQIPAVLTLKELAEAMNKAGAEVVKLLMKKGKMITINDTVDFETASEIALEFNVLTEEKVEIDILEETFGEKPEDDSIKQPRPPVVVVMGHVDHGKTSLLDAIRNANVQNQEAGGITQHIGAYTVAINNKPITFLDTPGHEAFTAMRMRGAKVTDIAVLVIAADDGVMPQTVEAISHAKAAGVEIIVALNMMDKPSANPDRVKQELVEHGLVAEEWGGETICVPVSAKTKMGIDTLLEMIILVSEMKDYKANPDKHARGTVIEAFLDKGRGPVATVLVQDGTLQVGDPIVAGVAYGKVRAMTDDKGRRLKKAGPSIPVEILGLSEAPQAGDLFHVAANDKQARHVAQNIFAKSRIELIKETPQKVSLEDLFTQIQDGSMKELNIIVKADVQGSVEAVKSSLEKLSNNEVRVKVLLGGVGAVTESDVMLASASSAIIIGFNVRPEAAAKTIADEQKVDVRLYRVIYNAIEDIQAAMKGMLDPVYEEKVIGHAEIRQTFKASGVGTIGGCYVTDGKIVKTAKVRITRDNIVVYEGTLDALRRFKDDAKEVNSGYECGMTFTKFNDIKEKDVVEAYIMQQINR